MIQIKEVSLKLTVKHLEYTRILLYQKGALKNGNLGYYKKNNYLIADWLV